MFHPFKKLGRQYQFMMITYVILMTVIILLSTLGYLYAYTTLKRGLEINFAAVINEQQLSYDQAWRRAQANIRYLASNASIRKLLEISDWNGSDRIQAPALIKEIAAMQHGYDWFAAAGVYMYRSQSLLTDTSRYEEPLIDLYFQNFGFDADQFISRTVKVDGLFLSQKNQKEYVVFYYNIYSSDYKQVIGTAFCVLLWSQIRADSAGLVASSPDSGVFLQLSSGERIGVGRTVFPEEDTRKIASGQSRELVTGGKAFIVARRDSETLDASYYLYAPRDLYLNDINILSGVIVLEVVLSVLVGGFLSHVFSKKTALPIERLRGILQLQQDFRADSSVSKLYENLEYSLQKLANDHAVMKNDLQSKNQTLESFALTSLMRGSAQSGWLEDYLPKLRDRFGFEKYTVVVFSIGELTQSGENFEAKWTQTVEDYSLLIFAIRNIISEVIFGIDFDCADRSELKRGLLLEVSDMIICVVDIQYFEERKLQLRDEVNRCLVFFNDALKIRSTAAISAVHQGISQVHLAYDEALATLTHSSFWGADPGKTLSFSEVADEPDRTADLNNRLFEMAQSLSRQLIAHNYSQASQTLDMILDECFYEDIRLLVLNRYQAATLICLLVTNLLEKGLPIDSVLPFVDPDNSGALIPFRSLDEMKKHLHRILDSLTSTYEANAEKHGEPEWLTKAEEYIRRNYADPMLNVSFIADSFNVTPAYLGKIFKKFRSEGVLEFIHKLRILESKKMMTKNISVSDCAVKLGYADAKSFIRAFKRYENITPGQFKVQLIDDKQARYSKS